MENNIVLLANPGLLQETLHIHHENKKEQGDATDALEGVICESVVDGEIHSKETLPSAKKSLLRNWPLMSAIIVYCVFQLHDMAYSEVIDIFRCFILIFKDNFPFC